MDREYETAEAIRQPRSYGPNMGPFALSTVVLMTLLLIVGMVIDKQRVGLAVICGVGFFSLFGGMVILVLSGQLTEIVKNQQDQVTIRLHDERQFLLLRQEVKVAELPQLATEVPQLPTFVPAVPTVADEVKLSCYDFVVSLFKDGRPDPERILPEGSKRPGQVQMSKPRAEVVAYLSALGMIRTDPQTRMLFFNVKDYPTLREAQQAIKHNQGRKAL